MIRRIALAALLALPLTSCSVGGAPKDAQVCGVIVDATGYKDYPTSGELITQKLQPFLDGCSWVAFNAITGRSEGTDCTRPSFGLYATKEESNGNSDKAKRIHNARLDEAQDHANYLLKCPKDGSEGSDVLGGFRAMAIQLKNAPDQAAKKRLIVFSDLVNRTPALVLPSDDYATQDARKAKIEELKEGRLIPDLGGVAVIVYGFNLRADPKADRVPQLRQLWEGIFAAAGTATPSIQ